MVLLVCKIVVYGVVFLLIYKFRGVGFCENKVDFCMLNGVDILKSSITNAPTIVQNSFKIEPNTTPDR